MTEGGIQPHQPIMEYIILHTKEDIKERMTTGGMMPENNIEKDRHRHQGTEDQHQEEDKTDEKATGELDETIEDIDPMTIITMRIEEDHPHVPGATKDIEVAKNIIKEDRTVTHIQIHKKDRLYRSQYQ